jgi:hypothetical protein
MGLVMKHKVNVRMMSMVKYWRVDPQTLKLKFFQREGFYLGTVAVLVLLSLLKIPRVAFADRVFGLGVLDASHSTMQGHPEIDLPSYRSSFDDTNSPANPEAMLHQALAQHVVGRYEVSATMFSVLQRMNQRGMGGPEFASKSTQALLEQASEAALARQPLEPTLVRALLEDDRAVAADPAYCQKSADYVHGLGFYALSGLLYKCAFYEDYGNKDHARAAIADLWQETRRCEDQPPPLDEQSQEDRISFVRQFRRNCYFEIDLFRTQLLREQEAGRLGSNGANANPVGKLPPADQGL